MQNSVSKKLNKGNYLLSGEIELILKSGKISAILKELKINEKISIPQGKRVPIEVIEDSLVELNYGIGAEIEKIESSTIPQNWTNLLNYISERNIKSVIMFGEVDTGKTFLTIYITNYLIKTGKTVAVIDTDTGQSDIGPPGTIGFVTIKEQIISFSDLKPDGIYFVGSHSPSLHFLHYIVGFSKLVKLALAKSDILLIDTPGWVHGDGGRALRRSEIEIFTPDLIVLLQRGDELEYLAKLYEREKIFRLSVSKEVKMRSTEDRKKLREKMSKKYFENAKEFTLDFDSISTDRVYLLTGENITNQIRMDKVIWAEKYPSFEGVAVVSKEVLNENELLRIKEQFGTGRIRNIVEGQEVGIEVALCDIQSDVIALGIIKKIDFVNRKIHVISPVDEKGIKKVKIVQFGSLRLNFDGSEAGFVHPGTF